MDDTHVAVLIEDLRGQFQVFGEALKVTNEKLDVFAKGTNERFDGLDHKLDLAAADVAVLKTDVAVLKTDVAVLKTDVAVLKTDVAVLKTDMSDVKTRVARVEHVVNGGSPKRTPKK